VSIAAAHGIPNLEADVLTENHPMQTLVRRRGVATMGDGEDFTVVRVAIAAASGERPGWPSTPGRHRMLVEATSGHWAHARDAERAGFEVFSCAGPDARCPALQGRSCPLVAGADVVVIARPPRDEHLSQLVAAHARLEPDVPVVLPRADQDPVEQACLLLAGSPAAGIIAALRTSDLEPD
jgi:hypothetical protein